MITFAIFINVAFKNNPEIRFYGDKGVRLKNINGIYIRLILNLFFFWKLKYYNHQVPKMSNLYPK